MKKRFEEGKARGVGGEVFFQLVAERHEGTDLGDEPLKWGPAPDEFGLQRASR